MNFAMKRICIQHFIGFCASFQLQKSTSICKTAHKPTNRHNGHPTARWIPELAREHSTAASTKQIIIIPSFIFHSACSQTGIDFHTQQYLRSYTFQLFASPSNCQLKTKSQTFFPIQFAFIYWNAFEWNWLKLIRRRRDYYEQKLKDSVCIILFYMIQQYTIQTLPPSNMQQKIRIYFHKTTIHNFK